MTDTLKNLAHAAGLNTEWTNAFGKPQQVSPDSLRAVLEELGFAVQGERQLQESLARIQEEQSARKLPSLTVEDQDKPIVLPYPAGTRYQVTLENGERIEGKLDADSRLTDMRHCGYHTLHIGESESGLAIAPAACPSVEDLTSERDARVWGATAQIYSLRRPGDGGLGDTGALEMLARDVASRGADVLAISPLHAIFSPDAASYSPYSPSSRIFHNILHAAPDRILGEQAWQTAIDQCGVRSEMNRLESLQLIDWPAVTALRLRLLRQLYENFSSGSHPQNADLAHFSTAGGEALQQHCRFEALQAHMIDTGHGPDWHDWPVQYRDPHSPAVEDFATRNTTEVGFHCFAQWLAVSSLDRARRAGRDAGMRIGLIADLAVGAHGAGSQTWSRQEEFLSHIDVGAPPDILSDRGQNWGVAAFSPYGLRKCGYRAFIEMVRANLLHADGLRIDHVMGLKRLWVIPDGASPDQGAYLNYPFEEQLRLLSLEAWRHKALIIGEDLGTVPEGMRDTLSQRNILGMRVLLFEQDEGRFVAPEQWPDDALATTTTHDLPTINGWFKGRDIDWRSKSKHRTPDQTEEDRDQRQKEKLALLDALRESGQLEEGQQAESTNSIPGDALEASLGFVGSTPAPLALLPLEDIMGTDEQPNLPGPGDTHPNWRRRWPMNANEMLDSPQVKTRIQRFAAKRTRGDHTP